MPFKAHSLSLIGLAEMHVSRLRKQIAAVPARLCNKWLMHMYGRLKQRDGSARCLCFTPARLQRANVFLSHQLDDWSRYFCSFIKTERWSVLLSSGNSHTERWLFQAYVNTYSRGVSGDISVLTVPSVLLDDCELMLVIFPPSPGRTCQCADLAGGSAASSSTSSSSCCSSSSQLPPSSSTPWTSSTSQGPWRVCGSGVWD